MEIDICQKFFQETVEILYYPHQNHGDMKHYFIFLLFSLTLLQFSCKKESKQQQDLPPATQTGERTFGCYINGRPWIPTGAGPGFPAVAPAVFSDGINQLRVFVRAYSRSDYFEIYLADPVAGMHVVAENGNVYPNNLYRSNYCAYNINTSGSDIVYKTTSQFKGYVNITRCDTIANIVSGTFEFTGVNLQTGDTVRVTGGRFDTKN
jgi:hypothetical protein